MKWNKDASSCILFMIVRMQSKRSALALLHIWCCRKNIILEKKGLYVWTWLVVHFFKLFKSPSLTFEIHRLMMRFFGCMEVNKKWLLSKFYHLYKVSSRKLVYFISLSALLLYYLPLEYHALYLIIFCFG